MKSVSQNLTLNLLFYLFVRNTCTVLLLVFVPVGSSPEREILLRRPGYSKSVNCLV